MSSTRSIAIFGYGTVGKPTAQAIADRGATLLIFSRDASRLKDVPPSAKLFTVDYAADGAEIGSILKEHAVDAVLSTIAESLLQSQVGIARVAKEAGVKLFLPSEFGFNSAGHAGDSIWAAKETCASDIKALGMPTARIMTGLFSEFIPWLVCDRVDRSSGRPMIAGKGEAKFSTTSIFDIAGYIAYILTALPLSDLNDTVLCLEGQSINLRDVAVIYGKEPKFVTLDTLQSESHVRLLSALIESGRGKTGFSIVDPDASEAILNDKSGSGNALWAGHKWQQLKDAVPTMTTGLDKFYIAE